MKSRRRELAAAAVASLLTLASLAAADAFDPLPSKVYDWNAMPEQPTAVGARRPFFRGETAALGELQAHVTTILPGKEPHPPHRHANEELIIVLRGTVAVTIEGETQRVGAGSSVFLAPNDFHGLRNVGDEPAAYYIVQMRPR
jgi:XRE family transcriptional regulator, regulator of sulfur utilization